MRLASGKMYFDYFGYPVYSNILVEYNLILDVYMNKMEKLSLQSINPATKYKEKGTMAPFNSLLQHSSVYCSGGQETVTLLTLGFK